MSDGVSYFFLFPAHQVHNILLLSSGLLINGYGADWLVGWTCREESEQIEDQQAMKEFRDEKNLL